MLENQVEDVDNVVEEVVEPIQEIQDGELSSDDESATEESQEQPAQTHERTAEYENSQRAKNWRGLRDAKEQAERERDDALRQLKNGGYTKSDDYKEFSLGDDDLAEGKHIKALKEENNRKLLAIESQLIEQKIKNQFPDFDKVVTPDTLGMLRDEDPELAESILSNKSMHGQMVTAYKSIKRLGIVVDDKFVKDKAIAQRNSSKPKPSASVSPQQGESPLSRANAFADGLTDDLKAQLLKEMEEARSHL